MNLFLPSSLPAACLAWSLLAMPMGCDDPAEHVQQPSAGNVASTSDLLSGRTSDTNIDTSPLDSPPEDSTKLSLLGLTAPKPATWIWQPPKRTMRKANFTIPGRDGEDPAELVINHFPEAPGNTLDANLSRWSKQFRTIDGGNPKPLISTTEADSMPVTIVELHGEYMGMGGHWHKLDHRMLMAIVDAPVGTIFIKLLGPDETVEASRDDYMSMITRHNSNSKCKTLVGQSYN